MAEERDDSQKTEEPTQRQLQQAEERGDVAQSPDIPAWMVLAAAAAIMMMWSGKMANDLRVMMTTFIARPDTISITPQSAGGFVTSVGWELLAILALPFAAFVAVAIAGHVVQHPPVFSVEKLQPDLSRLSPMKGFARLFGMPALVNFVKGILKTIAVAVAVVVTVWPERDTMIGMITLPVALLLPIVQDLMVKILTAALAVLGLIAILDYVTFSAAEGGSEGGRNEGMRRGRERVMCV
jgi:flagellar biosynthetic protein FlhB